MDGSDNSYDTGPKIGIITRIMLYILAFCVLILVISYVYGFMRNVAPNIINNCVSSISQEAVYDTGYSISSRTLAEQAIFEYIGENATFHGTSFEICGIAYLFSDTLKNKYVLCETGKLYSYIVICKNRI